MSDAKPVRISLDEATDYCIRVLCDHSTSPANAEPVARALVAAEADGLAGHGLSRLESYVGQAATGKVDGFAVPVVDDRAPAVIAIDAANGFAYPAIDIAAQTLPTRARIFGMAAATIFRSHHCGAAGLTVERLAKAGFAALMFANTPEAIAPAGGTRPVFGTNPIAFAAPLLGRPPLVIDLSLSTVARGNILKAKQEGKAIPEGWAFDADGKPTTDPEKALAGTMAALGGAKGTALALMVEVMAAGMTSAHFAFEASSFFTAEGPPPGTGQFIVAFDPVAFAGEKYGMRMATLVAEIESQDGARLPGTRRLENREHAADTGIILPPAVIAAFGLPEKA
ncbi:MAG: Ldh family oxidoreductase [Rhodobiaceae bacterium]|nr:Ldh family oxidoreductase [Rhodobiaceae bacterium]